MLQTEFFLPRVMSKITSSEGVVVPSPEINTYNTHILIRIKGCKYFQATRVSQSRSPRGSWQRPRSARAW